MLGFMNLNPEIRSKLSAKVGDEVTSFKITRMEGLDWRADVFWRDNPYLSPSSEDQDQPEGYVSLVLGSGVPGRTEECSEIWMTVDEFDQFTSTLSGLSKKWAKRHS